MDILNSELNKPASSLYRHNLLGKWKFFLLKYISKILNYYITGLLESAIRSSNAQYHQLE